MPVNVVAQRIPQFSRAIWYPETAGSPGVDPGAPVGIVLPLRDKSGFQIKQSTAEAPVTQNQSLLPFDHVYGLIDASGLMGLGLEFLACPALLKAVFGPGGYTKTAMVAGALHDFYIAPGVSIPGSGQIQSELGETTAQYLRARYCRVRGIKLAYAASGATPFDVDFVGNGDSVVTDLAGSKTWNGYPPVNQFNGQALINALGMAGMPNFNWNLLTGAAPFYGALNQGVATSVNPGVIKVNGSLELAMAAGGAGPEADMTFYNYSVNQQLIPLDCSWWNGPLATATQYMHVLQPTNRFTRASWVPGGQAGITVVQPYNMVYDSTNSKIAAYTFGTTLGTYNITAGNTNLAFKIDGGGSINTVLTNGAARTAAQIVADLQGNGAFTAVAKADVWGGYVRVTSLTKGITSSVQCDAGQASNASATIGMVTTSIAGYNSPILIRVWNTQTAVYA